MPSRRSALVAVFALALLALACKKDSAPAPSPSPSAKPVAKRLPNGQCPPPGSTCAAGEYEKYTSCVDAKCAKDNAACFGPDYQKGTFAGPCKDQMACTAACACDDAACMQKCAPSAECRKCLGTSVLSCVQSAGCEVPACAAP